MWNHKIYWTVLQLNFTHLVHCFKKCTNNSFRRINASIYKQEMNWTCKSLYWVCKYTCINSSKMSHLVCFYIHRTTVCIYMKFSVQIFPVKKMLDNWIYRGKIWPNAVPRFWYFQAKSLLLLSLNSSTFCLRGDTDILKTKPKYINSKKIYILLLTSNGFNEFLPT